MNKIIITTSPFSSATALNELMLIDNYARLDKWLIPGVGIINLSVSFDIFTKNLKNTIPVFVRHLMPVYDIFNLTGNVSDLEIIFDKVQLLFQNLDKEIEFSVQSRLLDKENYNYTGYAINEKISNYLEKDNYTLNVTQPLQIISIICYEKQAYIATSTPEKSLSNWLCGNIRFKKEENQISRAEFKLLEAKEVFNLNFDGKGKALDLGAAPGGFTKILNNFGYLVVAVDPAILHSSLLGNEQIFHKKMTAQSYFKTLTNEQFAIITNDMKMDIDESINIMIMAKPYLSPNGFCVMTLKLGETNPQKQTNKSLKILSKHFKIIGARQLFHNRSEVTVVFKNL